MNFLIYIPHIILLFIDVVLLGLFFVLNFIPYNFMNVPLDIYPLYLFCILLTSHIIWFLAKFITPFIGKLTENYIIDKFSIFYWLVGLVWGLFCILYTFLFLQELWNNVFIVLLQIYIVVITISAIKIVTIYIAQAASTYINVTQLIEELSYQLLSEKLLFYLMNSLKIDEIHEKQLRKEMDWMDIWRISLTEYNKIPFPKDPKRLDYVASQLFHNLHILTESISIDQTKFQLQKETTTAIVDEMILTTSDSVKQQMKLPITNSITQSVNNIKPKSTKWSNSFSDLRKTTPTKKQKSLKKSQQLEEKEERPMNISEVQQIFTTEANRSHISKLFQQTQITKITCIKLLKRVSQDRMNLNKKVRDKRNLSRVVSVIIHIFSACITFLICLVIFCLILLLFIKPFDVGDRVEISGYPAVIISEINLLTTVSHTPYGKQYVIPNSVIYKSVVIQYKRTHFYAIEIILEVDFMTNFEDIYEIEKELKLFLQTNKDYEWDEQLLFCIHGISKTQKIRIEIWVEVRNVCHSRPAQCLIAQQYILNIVIKKCKELNITYSLPSQQLTLKY
ncbi:Small-conductance mechanosensitive ion channel [Entamoeba marina]